MRNIDNINNLSLWSGKRLAAIEHLLFDKGHIKREELDDYSKGKTLGGIIPTNTSLTQLTSQNNDLCDILAQLLLNKNIFSMEEYSNTMTDIDSHSNVDLEREKVLEQSLQIENLYDYLREKEFYTNTEIKNLIAAIATTYRALYNNV